MARIVPDIVEQHAEEAAFLWSLRDAATDQPHITLRDLADLEERIEAHLDGLRIAGDAGPALARAVLERFPGPAELFVTQVLALQTHEERRIDEALEIADSIPEARRGLFGALGWTSPGRLRGQVVSWLEAPSVYRRLDGVVACSLHRADPRTHFERLLSDESPVRARALRLAGELGRADLRQQIRRAVADEDEACRFWAAWSAGLLGDREASLSVLQSHATENGPFKWLALDLAVRLLERAAAVEWLRDLGRDPANARAVVVGTGVLGDPIVIPWLIERMALPHLARVAGESFAMITGADLSREKLEGKAPAGVSPEDGDGPDDGDPTAEADANLPWPDTARVEDWWAAERTRFAVGVRYLAGRPVGWESCQEILRTGLQRQRRAAVYELALTRPATQLWNWRALARRQMAGLSASA
jgi:uncharacterized protein (TIGR02270 family)